jgi:diguanylate cyclase (GGDEF)-like protein
MEWAVIDRRLLLAACGAVLGIAGALAALVLSPLAALVSAAGALIAAAGAVLTPSIAASAPEAAASAAADATANHRSPVVEAQAPVPQAVESNQMATANAPSAPPSTPAPPPRSDSSATVDPPAPISSAPALTDPETGLFSQDYFDIAIDARIAAARRHLRPVGVVMLEVVEGLRVGRTHATDPKRVAEAIQETLREADTACRRSDGRFALLLEDTPENGAIWTVERIRRFLAERDPTLTLWAGVACYPAHGFSSDALVKLAGVALDTAREWRQDRIEVAVGE